MFNLMRAHQRKILLVVTVLTIIAFAFFYTYYDAGSPGAGAVAKVYGRDLTQSDFQREARKFQLALALGLTDYASSLGASGSDESLAEFVINKLVIDHEGARLGIQPTNDEIKTAITSLPVFQTGGQFDPEKYKQLVVNALAPRGFTELEIQGLVRSSLILNRLKQLLDVAPSVTPGEVTYLSRIFQPVSGVAVLFDPADYRDRVKVTDDEIAATFKANAANFVTPELRTIRYVRFELPAEDPKADPKVRIAAQQKAADAADRFATRATEIGFEKAAQEAGLSVQSTLPFDQAGKTQLSADLEKQVGSSADLGGPTQTFAASAFTLTPKAPITPVLEGKNEFLVGELANVAAARPQTLDEARPAIAAQLTQAAAVRTIQQEAAATVKKLRDAAKAGQPAATATAGLKTQPFTNASYFDEKADPAQRDIAQAALPFNDGEVSALLPAPNGAMILWLEKRGPVDAKIADQFGKELGENILAQRRQVLWVEWLRAAQQQAGISFPAAGGGQG